VRKNQARSGYHIDLGVTEKTFRLERTGQPQEEDGLDQDDERKGSAWLESCAFRAA
jgi:hypothetical protein